MCNTVFSLECLSLCEVKRNKNFYLQINKPHMIKKYMEEIFLFENTLCSKIQEELELPSIVAGRGGEYIFFGWEIFLICSQDESNIIFSKMNKLFPKNFVTIDIGYGKIFRVFQKNEIKIWILYENCHQKLWNLRQNKILFVEKLLENFKNEMTHFVGFLLPNKKYLLVSFATEKMYAYLDEVIFEEKFYYNYNINVSPFWGKMTNNLLLYDFGSYKKHNAIFRCTKMLSRLLKK